MANETAARRYADAVFQLARERRAVPEVGSDLHAIASALYQNPQTKGFFLSPVIGRTEKERMLASTLAPKGNDIAVHTVLLLVRKRRESLLPEIVRQYDVLEMRARGDEPLTILSARELPATELRAFVARLEAVYRKTFEVQQRADPKLIGGVRIVMGDRRIDGSVAGRLEELARTLSAAN